MKGFTIRNFTATFTTTTQALAKIALVALSSFPVMSQAATPVPAIFSDSELTQNSLIGNVFYDKNGDGIKNSGEPGIPGVRLYSVTGLVIETDAYGRFHIAEEKNQEKHILLKLDLSSLPTGTILTTENPRAIRTANSHISKINFGLKFKLNK